MREQLERRLEVLRKEFDTGQTRLREVERQQVSLRETLLRISGAIQVLEELLAEASPGMQPLTHGHEPPHSTLDAVEDRHHGHTP
jgi:predicted nuclease with TOPRIM domain